MTVEELDEEIKRLEALKPGEAVGWDRKRLLEVLKDYKIEIEDHEETTNERDAYEADLEATRAEHLRVMGEASPLNSLSRKSLEAIIRGDHCGDTLMLRSAAAELSVRDAMSRFPEYNGNMPMFPTLCYFTR